MCDGCNTSSATTTANPDAQAAYTDVVGKAQAISGTPYQAYPGELVAGINNGQQTAINRLSGAYGAAQPYIGEANGYLANGAAGLGNVQDYLTAGSDANAGVAQYQGLAGNAFGQSGGYAGQSAAALASMQPYMAQTQQGLGAAAATYGLANGAAANMGGLATPVDFNSQNLQQYLNPYTQSVIDTTMAQARQNDAQQTSSLVSNSIGSGAYGGDRNGIAVATLAGQQDMANNSTVAGLNSANYSQAVQQFNQEQADRFQGAGIYGQQAGVYNATAAGQTQNALGSNALAQDAAQQASGFSSLGSLANQTGAGYNSTGQLGLGIAGNYDSLGTLQGTTGQSFGTLGNAASALGQADEQTRIAGASAGLQGQTLQQQNAQQQDTAAYNQYMAGLSYPYQQVGFLSNIVQGIGSQEGNTSTTQGNALSSIAGLGTSSLGILGATGAFGANGYLTGAGGLLSASDERVKENIAPIGKTFDGQTMYRYNYKGDHPSDVKTGLIAQEVAQRDPGAVGHVGGGVLGVDYDRATSGAARRGLGARPPRAMGGGVPMGLGAAPVQMQGLGGLPGFAGRPRFLSGGDVQDVPIPAGGLNTSPAGLTGNGLGFTTSPASLTATQGSLGMPQPIAPGRPIPMGGPAPTASSGFGVLNTPPSTGLGSAGTVDTGGAGTPAFSPGAASGADSASSGSGASQGQGGGLSQNVWLGILAAGLGMMGGTSASAAANIGQGGLEGLKMWNSLNQQDRNYGVQQQDVALKKGNLALEGRKEDFAEMMAQRLIDASAAASRELGSATAPQFSPSSSPTAVVPGAAANAAIAAGSNPRSINDASRSGQSSVVPPVLGTSDASATPPPVENADFWTRVSPESNPAYLTQQSQRFMAAGRQMLASGQAEQANQMFQQSNNLVNRARQIYDTGNVVMKDGSAGLVPGFVAVQAEKTGASEQAKADVQNQYDLVKVADPNGGGDTYVPKSAVLAAARGGPLPRTSPPGAGSPPGTAAASVVNVAPYLASQPAFIADAQKDKAKGEAEMDQQFQARQVSLQRIGDLQAMMTKYQTGDLAGAKADAVALGRALGVPVKDSDTANPAFYQRFIKDATANVFNDVKGMGGRVLVSEIEGLTKANANPEMQPDANAAILNQAKGVIGYEDQHYKDYMGWRDQNPNAWNASQFEIGWQKDHNVQQYVDQAGKNFAYKGQDIPSDPTKRSAGQMYMTPKGPLRWMGSGWAAN